MKSKRPLELASVGHLSPKNILKQRKLKKSQKHEFLGYTMTSHDFKHDMDGFYISQSFQRVQDHPIRSSNKNDTAS